MTMKKFYNLGLAVEEAIERRDEARERLRAAAEKACPNELRALDEAADALKVALNEQAKCAVEMMNDRSTERMVESAIITASKGGAN